MDAVFYSLNTFWTLIISSRIWTCILWFWGGLLRRALMCYSLIGSLYLFWLLRRDKIQILLWDVVHFCAFFFFFFFIAELKIAQRCILHWVSSQSAFLVVERDPLNQVKLKEGKSCSLFSLWIQAHFLRQRMKGNWEWIMTYSKQFVRNNSGVL